MSIDNSIIKIKVLKYSGELVDFDISKLKSALIRSGASESDIENIILDISNKLYDGINTRKIYKIAYSVLRKKSHNVAGRYRLKKAVLDLGPSGYPFEKFVGRLFQQKGYDTKVGIVVKGKCVTHEIDVLAKNNDKQIYVECKFHKDRKKNSVKIPMYIKSRFDDVKNNLDITGNNKLKFKGMIITNTRFSKDAIAFGKCAGVELIGWDYPKKGNLRDWIDQAGYHPVTSLNSITKRIKQKLMAENVILCREVESNQHILQQLGLKQNVINKVVKEAKEIMKY